MEALSGAWASTSTKDQTFPDTIYVEPLIGPQTINTMPNVTVDAVRDHGKIELTVENDLPEYRQIFGRLQELGIEIDRVTDELVEEGIEKFIKPFDQLIEALDKKRSAAMGD